MLRVSDSSSETYLSHGGFLGNGCMGADTTNQVLGPALGLARHDGFHPTRVLENVAEQGLRRAAPVVG